MNTLHTPAAGSVSFVVNSKIRWSDFFLQGLFRSLVGILFAFPLTTSSHAQVVTNGSVIATFEGSGVENSALAGAITYTFNNLPVGTNETATWSNNGVSIGTFSNLNVNAGDQYGGSSFGATNANGSNYGGNSTYASANGNTAPYNTNSATGIKLTFNAPQAYFGIWWSAGDSGNTLAFYSGSNLVANYNTAWLYSQITNYPAFMGMPSGPNKGQDSGEPFTFLNFFASNFTFTSIVAYETNPTGNFESDNWTINTNITSNTLANSGVTFDSYTITNGITTTNNLTFHPPTLASNTLTITNGVSNFAIISGFGTNTNTSYPTVVSNNTYTNTILYNGVLLGTNQTTVLSGTTNVTYNLNLSNSATTNTVGGTNYTEQLSNFVSISGNLTSSLSTGLIPVTNSTNFTIGLTNNLTLGSNSGSIVLTDSSVTNGTGSARLGPASPLGSQTITILTVKEMVATPLITPTNVSLGFFHAGESVVGTNISIANISPNTAYTETLGFTTGASTGGITNNGANSTTIAAGTTNTSLVVGGPSVSQVTNTALNITNVFTGTQVINLSSVDINGNLAPYSLGSQTVTVNYITYSGQSTWMSSNGGNWSSFSSWNASGGTPGLDGIFSTNDTATFNTNGSGPVNLNTNASIMSLNFSNAASSYTISGVGTLTLTNGSNAASINTYAGSNTVSAALNIASALTISNASGGTLDLAGPVGGTTGFTQTGTGTTILEASNNFAGNITINSGTLAISNNNAFSTGTVTFQSNTAIVEALTNVSVTNNYIINNAGGGGARLATFDVVAGATMTNSGIISQTVVAGNSALTKTDSGTLVLTGVNTYTGVTTISGGTLQLGTNGSTGTIGNGTGAITDNGNLAFDFSNSTNFAQTISGSGTVTQIGTGTTILTGNNSYRGGTVVDSGTLVVSNANGLGATTGTITVNDGGTLNLSNNTITSGAVSFGSATITGTGSLNGASYTGTNTGTALIQEKLTGSGNFVQSGSGTTILTTANTYSGTTTINAGGTIQIGTNGTTGTLGTGSLTDNGQVIYDLSSKVTNSSAIAGTGAVTQIGSGTLFLTGTNTYSGTTTIGTNSTLSLGTTGNLTASTNIIVSNGGTLLLGGTNQTTTNSDLTLNGGTLSTGGGSTARAGTNNFNTLTLTANSTIDFSQLTGNTALDFNSILGLGTYTLTILDWSGTMNNGTVIGGGTNTGLFDFSSLTPSELSHISFYSGPSTNSGFLGTGSFNGHQIVPVPEISVIVTGGFLLAWLVVGLFYPSPKTIKKLPPPEYQLLLPLVLKE